jgi:2-dehydropantoate 2-reductase
MDKPVLIWGAGAIGATIGAHLVRAKQPVLFVDTATEHVARMTASGLTIEGPLGGFTVEAAATTPDDLQGTYDVVLLAVKSQHTAAAAASIRNHLAERGYVVSCQNGLNEPTIAEVVGSERTVGAFVNFAGDYLAPGRITYGLRGTFAIGELDGHITSRITALRKILEPFEPSVTISTNIFGFLWSKASYAAVLTASALTHETIADFIGDPVRRHLIKCLVREVLTVAVADNVTPAGFDTFEPGPFLANDEVAMNESLDALAAFNRGTGKTHSGVWRDLAVRKRKTEVVAQFVPVRQAADRHGLKLPLVDKLAESIAAIESGEQEQGRALADSLSALAGTLYR